jgi:hypothetical protein
MGDGRMQLALDPARDLRDRNGSEPLIDYMSSGVQDPFLPARRRARADHARR